MNAVPATARSTVKSDAQLVRRCLAGDEAAWSALIDRYKNLIFSIPIKYGFSREDAADIFQMVCADLVSELAKVRQPGALPKWLMQVTSHKCFQRMRELKRFTDDEPDELVVAASGEMPEKMLQEVEQEQAVRDALGAMAPRCRDLIRMLFYETPCRPYAEIARELGLATGSIGFIRGRCLEKMRRRLAQAGVR